MLLFVQEGEATRQHLYNYAIYVYLDLYFLETTKLYKINIAMREVRMRVSQSLILQYSMRVRFRGEGVSAIAEIVVLHEFGADLCCLKHLIGDRTVPTS
jgi:hypothetical protein